MKLDEAVPEINSLKKLIDNIAKDSKEKSTSLREELASKLEKAKEQKLTLDLATREHTGEDRTTLAEYTINKLFENMRSLTGETEALLLVLDSLFTQIPSLVNHINQESKQPLLHLAVWTPVVDNKSIKIVKNLLELFFKHHADFNIRDLAKRTAAHVVVAKNNVALLPKLVECGCGINRFDAQQRTPLDDMERKLNQTHKETIQDLGGVNSKSVLSRISGTKQKSTATAKTIPTESSVSFFGIDTPVIDYSVPETKDESGHLPSFNPNLADTEGKLPPFTAIDEGDDEKAIAEIVQYIHWGLDLSLKNEKGHTLFDALAEKQKLHAFLKNPIIRAAFLSSERSTPEEIRKILGREREEAQALNQHQVSQTAILPDQEEEERRKKRKFEIKALIASKKSKESKEEQTKIVQDRAKTFIVSILKSCSSSQKLIRLSSQTTFTKHRDTLTKESWDDILEKLKNLKKDNKHVCEYIQEQLTAKTPTTASAP